MVQDIDFIIIGHPRCGSASLSHGLKAAGFDAPHEHPGKDGMVSWWHTGFFEARDDEFLVVHRKGDDVVRLRPRAVFRYLRNPADAIPSIMIENEHNGRDNNSFRHRSRVIYKNFGVDLKAMGEIEAAAASYAYWNDLASLYATDPPILVESPSFRFGGKTHSLKLERRNESKKKFGRAAEKLPLDEVLSACGIELRDRISGYIGIYR